MGRSLTSSGTVTWVGINDCASVQAAVRIILAYLSCAPQICDGGDGAEVSRNTF